jgi:hypothetical protein
MGDILKKCNSVVVIFLLSAMLAALPTAAADRYVGRDISSGSVPPNGQVDVTLYVTVNPGDRFFLIDEIIPEGWIIIDNGGLFEAGTLNASEGNHLKKAVIQTVSGTSYTYRIQAPPTTGTYAFSGTYYIEGMGGTMGIEGEAGINVGTFQSNVNNDNSNSGNGVSGYVSGGPPATACPDGAITAGCACQGVYKESGYCCGNDYQTIPCDTEQGPLPILAECNDSDIKQCGSNIGVCSYGTRKCENGIWSNCVGGVTPSIESYDGIDNDCDGEADEGCSDQDIARCSEDSSLCVCTGDFQPTGSIQGNAPLSVPFDSAGWVLVIIISAAIISSAAAKKFLKFQKFQKPAIINPLPPPPEPPQPQEPPRLLTGKEAMLMAMKGAVKA